MIDVFKANDFKLLICMSILSLLLLLLPAGERKFMSSVLAVATRAGRERGKGLGEYLKGPQGTRIPSDLPKYTVQHYQ